MPFSGKMEVKSIPINKFFFEALDGMMAVFFEFLFALVIVETFTEELYLEILLETRRDRAIMAFGISLSVSALSVSASLTEVLPTSMSFTEIKYPPISYVSFN